MSIGLPQGTVSCSRRLCAIHILRAIPQARHITITISSASVMLMELSQIILHQPRSNHKLIQPVCSMLFQIHTSQISSTFLRSWEVFQSRSTPSSIFSTLFAKRVNTPQSTWILHNNDIYSESLIQTSARHTSRSNIIFHFYSGPYCLLELSRPVLLQLIATDFLVLMNNQTQEWIVTFFHA